MNSQSSKFSRRRFLKTTAAGATGLLAANSLAAPAIAETKSVRVLTVGDPFQFSLRDLLPEFTAKTGIKVEFEGLGYDALQARLISSFVSKTSDADVINVDQMWAGQYMDNGWIQPLDKFAKGDAAFNIKDFVLRNLAFDLDMARTIGNRSDCILLTRRDVPEIGVRETGDCRTKRRLDLGRVH